MYCERCGAVQEGGRGYCRVCSAPLGRPGQPPLAPSPLASPVRDDRGRRLTAITLAAVIALLLICLVLAALAFGLSSLIRWA